jgi:hypothetical protein
LLIQMTPKGATAVAVTYILILTLFTPGNTAVTAIPGFLTLKACENAGVRWTGNVLPPKPKVYARFICVSPENASAPTESGHSD